MKILSIIVATLFLACFSVKAQDPHFSQYYAAPLSLNPANTGFFDGDLRLGLNERQQWWNVGYNYNTTSIFGDVKLFKDRLPEYDAFALGFSGIFENSLNGSLHSTYLSVSGAYHKNLSYQGSHVVGLGVQVNYTGKFFDYSQLTFASQFNGKIFDPSIPVTIGNSNAQSQYLDVNAGLLYAIHLNRANFYVGTSVYHLSKPTETIFNSSGSVIPLREAAHAGGQISLNETSSLLFSGYYMQQGEANDAMYGGAYGLDLNSNGENITLYAGLWHRVHSSYIPYLGADYKKFSLGLNYGLTANSDYGFSPQTFEISLIYKFKANYSQSAVCPRF
jgi:type IX secretion system PorP/SprF family membrane protein